MQLKKNPREGHYANPRARYEEEQMNEEHASPEFAPEPPTVSRPQRRPELEGETQPRPAGTAHVSSMVDAHSSFDGRYETDQDLRVEGNIAGEVVCRGLLTIERDATARAKIQAHDAEIRGRLEGDIVCTGRLLLTSTAVVIGTMSAGALVVEEGASLSGKVETSSLAAPARAAVAAAPAPAPRITPLAAAEPPAEGAVASPTLTTRSRREVPSFALVSSDDRASLDRN
ncbi:MAG: hypothetical protein C0506_16435 [Anaerolinea sp.]|nr:hypothetical protein [Anaerolinea sp.]